MVVENLVEGHLRRYGRLAARPADVNPLDEFARAERPLRLLRLKEWVGFTLVHPDWYCSFLMQDAHYLSSSEIYAYDRSWGTLHQQASARPGSIRMPPGLWGEHFEYLRGDYLLRYDFSDDPGHRDALHTIRLDIAAGSQGTAFQGDLELLVPEASAPLSVSARVPGGRVYTHKAIFPVRGALAVGDRTISFDPERDLAILDEHRSLFPYRTQWTWGTFATRVEGGLLGANFCARPLERGAAEESCLWVPGACEPLEEVSFTQRDHADPLAPWQIASADGRLDVIFEPEGRKDVRHQLGVLDIDYFQLFGRYRGVLRGASRSWDLDGVHGVCERFKARL